MFTFAGFEDYQPSEWVTEGLIKRCANVVNSVTASLKSAGAVAVVGLAMVSTPSLAVETTATAELHTEISASASESMLVVEHVNRMSKEIQVQMSALDNITADAIDPETLSLSEQVVAMMSAGGTGPTKGWAARVASGKAMHG
jgi:cytochrome b